MSGTILATKRELKQFGLLMGAMISLLFGVLFPKLFSFQVPVWPWMVGVTFVVAALAWPQVLRYVYRPWMRFAEVLGRVNSTILLSLVYFLLVVPMGWLRRLSGKRNLGKGFDRGLPTYRVDRSENDLVERMRRPF